MICPHYIRAGKEAKVVAKISPAIGIRRSTGRGAARKRRNNWGTRTVDEYDVEEKVGEGMYGYVVAIATKVDNSGVGQGTALLRRRILCIRNFFAYLSCVGRYERWRVIWK